MKQINNIVVIGILFFMAGVVSADTLLIRTVEKNMSVEKPDRGMSSVQVVSQYGQPVEKFSAIGEPPIKKWAYSNITVYFEYDHVIHSVVNKKK